LKYLKKKKLKNKRRKKKDQIFCGQCGTLQKKKNMFCADCGATIIQEFDPKEVDLP